MRIEKPKPYDCDNYPSRVLHYNREDGSITILDPTVRSNPEIDVLAEGPESTCSICQEFKQAKIAHKEQRALAKKQKLPYHGRMPDMPYHRHGNSAYFYYTEKFLDTEDVNEYDKIVVAFSGGKDSLACVLHLFDLGIPKEKIELWHHDVDGRTCKEYPESQHNAFADWPCTPSYCKKIAETLGVPIYFSWLSGGFEGELLKTGKKAPTYFETPHGVEVRGGKTGKEGTRWFPQMTANVSQRWCTAYLKIDVGRIALNNSPRFHGKRVLFISGERREESAARTDYAELEAHECDLRFSPKARRHIDHWRPIHKWSTKQVWDIIHRYGIIPHPCYYLGWGRCSCSICVFGSPNQWASTQAVLPHIINKVAEYEVRLGKTIDRELTISDKISRGEPYPQILDPEEKSTIRILTTHWDKFPIEVVCDPKIWFLPAGAFAEQAGPT